MPRSTGRLVSAYVGLAFGLSAAPLQATEVPSVRIADLKYDVYVGGLQIFSFDVEMTLEPDRYRVTAEGETRGVVGWLYTVDMKLAAEGADRGGSIAPQRYVAQTQWQSRRRSLELGFGGDGRYELQQTPPPEPDPDIEGGLPDALPKGSVDPLSFAVAATQALQENGRCDQTVPVFDGQRRFDMIVKQVGETVLPPSKYSIYQGPAMRCSLGIARISGFRKSLRPSERGAGSSGPPTIWMASMRNDLPPVPVRYEGQIALGTMVIHLTDAAFRTEPARAALDAPRD